MASTTTGGNSKNRISKPSKVRYWASRRLEARKVRHIMANSKMNKIDATLYWNKKRQGRVPNGYLMKLGLEKNKK